MLQMIRSLQVERLFLTIQPLLLGSLAKWLLLFAIIFLLLTIHKKLASDIRHVVLLLLIYAAVLIPVANAFFPLEWFGDTELTRQGNEISRSVSAALMPRYFEGMVGAVAPPAGTIRQSFTLSHLSTVVPWPVVLFTLWGVGAVVSSIGLIVGRVRVGILCRRCGNKPIEIDERELKELATKLGIRRRVELVIRRTCPIPFTFRVFHPLVVLPQTSKSWPSERVRAVLLHELSHIRRGDYFTKLLARTVCSLFWFLPFVWIAYSRLSREQETACDLSVLRRGIRPTEYAQHILSIAYISMRNLSFQGSFLAEGRKRTLERRIIHTLRYDRGETKNMGGSINKTTKLVFIYALVLAAIVVIGSCSSSRKTITGKDFLAAWKGTWINEELAGNFINPQMLVNYPDETMEFIKNPFVMELGKKDSRIKCFNKLTITDKWIDRKGRIWYTAATKRKTERGTVLSYYGFIHESGDVLEILEAMSTRIIEEWDTDNVWYYHRIYYRQ
jgi:beta-lactamase regulating signal transducer with metallopeptidase domain